MGQAGLGRGIEEMGWGLGWGRTTSRGTGIDSRAFPPPWPQRAFLDVPPGDNVTILSSEELHCKTGIVLEAKESLQTKIRWVGRPGRPTGEVKASRGLH